jgi:putative flippase GtrA
VRLAKLVRYGAVSAVSTTVSLSVLGILVLTGATTPGWANIIATAIGTVPSFELNRRWVWNKTGQRSLLAEVGPFCVLSFGGLALSTLTVRAAVSWAEGDGLSTGPRALTALMANFTTFGVLWVLQYFLLDRLLFKTAEGASGVDCSAPEERGLHAA